MAKKKKKIWWIIGIVALLAILIGGAILKGKSNSSHIKVETDVIQKRTIVETVSASGKIYPEMEVKISSDVSGEIVELHVAEGDSVVQGQLLAKIDAEAYLSAVDRGRAAVNTSKSQHATSRAQLESAKAQRDQINAQVENTRQTHDRNAQLFKSGVISQAEFDQSLSSLKQIQSNLSAAEANIESARQSMKAASYGVKSSEANLKELRTNLKRTSIIAPTSGIISNLPVEKGERVVGTNQMTGTEIMRIANLNEMEVQVNVSENDILSVEVGDKVDISVDAYLESMFKGKVTQIANSSSNISQQSLSTDQVTNFVVKIKIDQESYAKLRTSNNRYPLRPGMSASVDIFTEVEEGVLSLPIQAVTVRESDEEDKFGKKKLKEVVFRMVGDSVEMVDVKTGIQNTEYIVLKSGLSEGDRIATGPYSTISKKLEQGTKVEQKEKKKSKK